MEKKLSAGQIVDRLIADGCQNEIFRYVDRTALGKKFLDSLEDRNDVPEKWANHDGNLARDIKIRGRELKFTDDDSFYFAVEDFFRSLNEDFQSRYGIKISQGGRSGGWLEISAEDVGTLIRRVAENGNVVVEDEKSFRAALLKFVEEMMDWYAAELAGEQEFDAIGEGIYGAFVNQLYFDMEDRELYEDIDFSWFGFPTVERVMDEIDSAIESTLDEWERNDPYVGESRRFRIGRSLHESADEQQGYVIDKIMWSDLDETWKVKKVYAGKAYKYASDAATTAERLVADEAKEMSEVFNFYGIRRTDTDEYYYIITSKTNKLEAEQYAQENGVPESDVVVVPVFNSAIRESRLHRGRMLREGRRPMRRRMIRESRRTRMSHHR